MARAGVVMAAVPGAILALWLGPAADPADTAKGLAALVGKLDGVIRVVGLAAIGYGLVMGVAYPWLANRYMVGAECISEVYGIIAKRRRTTRLAHIRRVGVTQSVLGRVLGYGNVQFYSAGSGDVDVTFRGVRNPQALMDSLQHGSSVQN